MHFDVNQSILYKDPVMQIRYNTISVNLDDTPLDIGYSSEKVDLKNISGETFRIGGQNGATQLIVSAPFICDELIAQLKEIDSLLSINALGGITKALAVASDKHEIPLLEEWLIGYDYDEAYGDYYGVRLSGDELGGELAKALFIISKDGAVFHHEVLSDVNGAFNLEKTLLKIAAAQSCYTGKGCHG
jgi:peroxiredoxin